MANVWKTANYLSIQIFQAKHVGMAKGIAYTLSMQEVRGFGPGLTRDDS